MRGRRGSHVEGFREGDEAYCQLSQFLQGDDQVGKRTAPAVEPLNEDSVQFSAAHRGKQLLALRTLQGTRSNLPDLRDGLPASSTGVLSHGLDLERKRLLIVSRDPGVECDSKAG